jgi:Cys-tRNA(Pro)/Cys-tRNA(Cys) deacylase
MHHRIESLLQDTGTPYRELRHSDYPQPIKTPADVAHALGCELSQITKSLFMRTNEFMLVVLPVDRRIDFKKITAICGRRPEMALASELSETLDYPPLSVSPLACAHLPVILDSTLAEHEWVLVGSGEVGTEIEMSWHDLVALTSGKVLSVSISMEPF